MAAVRLLAFIVPLLLAACATEPPTVSSFQQTNQTAGQRAASNALKMTGTRYHFGGASPSAGFDCSGLVQYSYKQVGVTLPRL